MASISNIFIDQGADFTTTVTVTDSNGDAVSLVGYSAELHKSEKVIRHLHPLILLQVFQTHLVEKSQSHYQTHKPLL